MCGPDDDAAETARREEQARRLQTEQANAAIDAAFGRRQPQYNDFLAAARDFFMSDAKRQKAVADRRSKFALAGAGLTGGSAHRDAGRRLTREFNRGVLKAEQTAQSSLADLMSSDQESRLNLSTLAASGMGVGDAATRSAEMMKSNLAGAQSRSRVEGLGDIFGGSAEVFKRQEEAAARRRGLKESDIYSAPFSRGP